MNRSIALLLAAPAVALLAAPAAPCPADEGRTVYYQVTYADGSTRDLYAVPAGNEGIRRVLRITRIEQGAAGYEILATGPQPLTLVNRGQTYRTDLAWNGKAWVAPGEEPAATSRPAAGGEAQEKLAGARAELVELAARLMEKAQSLADQEAKRRASAKPPEAGTLEALATARKELLSAAAAVLAAARSLSPRAVRADEPPASGTVAPAAGAAPDGAAGIVTPTTQVAALPHRARVWKLPAADGRRTVHVSIAHPEAGAMGAFHYVAYADTDGDGRPDRLIARSPRASAEAPGAWTQWSFTTDQRDVFVGSAWSRPETSHYQVEAVRVEGGWRRCWRGLSPDAYVGDETWGIPNRLLRGLLGNIHVWVDQGGRSR